MLSRVAELVYWMSRYVERAENVARVVDVNLHLMLDAPPGSDQQWPPLIQTTGDHEAFARRHREATRDSVLHFLTFDPDNPNSILSCLSAARENARTVREIISSDMWEQLNRFYLMLCAANSGNQVLRAPHEFFSEVKLASQLFSGTTDNSLTHGEAWHFTRLGRMLERADQTSRILDVKYHLLLPNVDAVGGVLDYYQWQAILRAVSAARSYHWIYHERLQAVHVAELLILRPEMTRSLRSCYTQVTRQLDALGTCYGNRRGECHRVAGETEARLRFGRIE